MSGKREVEGGSSIRQHLLGDQQHAEFKAAVTPISVFVAFGVSGAMGVIFGTFPARRDANVKPIDALRYE